MTVAKLIINSIFDKRDSCLYMLQQWYFSATSFCFLVPLVLGIDNLDLHAWSASHWFPLDLTDPAISSVQHGFSRSMCRTVRGQYRQGKLNCAWTSCREGCTHEVYNCWQLEVGDTISGSWIKSFLWGGVQYLQWEPDCRGDKAGQVIPQCEGLRLSSNSGVWR